MAEQYDNYLLLRTALHNLDRARKRDRVAYHRLRMMQADFPWWYGLMFASLNLQHMGLRMRFTWLRLQLRLMALTLPARLRRML